MPNCCVINCDFRKSEKGEYQSFYFPKEPDLRRKWTAQVKRDNFSPGEKAGVCHRHFAKDDFEPPGKDKRGRTRKRMQLKATAFPTLFLGTETQPKTEKPRTTKKSVESLEKEKEDLEKEIKTLKDKIQYQIEVIENRDRKIEELQSSLDKKTMKEEKEFKKMEVKLAAISASIKKIFTSQQVEKLKCPGMTIGSWSDETIRLCIALYIICGTAAYKFMIAKGYPFVPVSTLQAHMSIVDFEPGLLEDMFMLMKFRLEEVPEHHRNLGLVLDEMSIQPKLDFDPSTQSFIGRPTCPLNPKTIERKKKADPNFDETKTMATHAMNFMLCGHGKRLKQIVAWLLTYSSFDPAFVADIMYKIVKMSHEISGATVSSITMDMSGQNLKL